MRPAILAPILDLTKQFVQQAMALEVDGEAAQAAVAVDGTVGNGHDTLFLAELAGPEGHVYGFDVQASALSNARERLASAGVEERVTLFHAGHEEARLLIPAPMHGQVRVAMFNLGYLPGGDKTIVTQPEATITALESVFAMLRPHGIITVHVYTGHAGGANEGEIVLQWASSLPWNSCRVARYDFCNKARNGEALLVIERLT
ncbi:methyltransferase domain-containing protein [Desulfovibrio mangrovi]|uniref:class I SAM-dependent methyltransferase n=1 Tax=Desulfovibrio mangrovi TaxID=2976983 RepID=UPI0022455E1D|nr:class I SAM-dependent methyltransferase [Desulfovibrio mangrovi]UZP66845.1 methyltransferase domain-containing protein [Desulfovibrio mangrovi]